MINILNSSSHCESCNSKAIYFYRFKHPCHTDPPEEEFLLSMWFGRCSVHVIPTKVLGVTGLEMITLEELIVKEIMES
jgi:hypothetical protein